METCGELSRDIHSTATLAPLFLHDWLPPWIRKDPWNARLDCFYRRGRSPISMISEAAPCSLRQRKSRRDRSYRSLPCNTAGSFKSAHRVNRPSSNAVGGTSDEAGNQKWSSPVANAARDPCGSQTALGSLRRDLHDNHEPSRASMIRLASATMSSLPLFSRVVGLSRDGEVAPCE